MKETFVRYFTLNLHQNHLIMKNLIAILLVAFAMGSFAQIPNGYYDSAEGLTGDELKAALHNIIDNHTTYPYTDSGTDVWDILKESDRDPNNANNVILLYTGWSVNGPLEYDGGSGWSREHVWAKSHGDFDNDPPAGTDAHHLRPCDISVNSARGNKDFDNGGTQHAEATECYTDADSWEPRPAVKGDVARMMFYMATRYEGDVSGEPDLELVDYTGTDGPFFGKLSTLIQWNTEDPVDEFERNRNEVVYSYQGNRNPFIDHPEYVNTIYNPENNAPEIDDQEFTIAENSENGTEVGTITSSDPDNDEISYSIISGNTDDAFVLGTTTGVLTVNNSDALVYDTNPSFSLIVEANDGWASASATIMVNVDQTNAVVPIASNAEIKVYPNPTSDITYAKIPNNYSVEVYSIIGSKIMETTTQKIDLSFADPGVYFVLIKDDFGNSVKSIKLLKR
ncbi:MAG: endonuclease [Bacteroidetes bacterium]|nr:endonuclease [Bacteroidota bacterium]